MTCDIKYGVTVEQLDEREDDFDEATWLSLIANIPLVEAQEHIAAHEHPHPRSLGMTPERQALPSSQPNIGWQEQHYQRQERR